MLEVHDALCLVVEHSELAADGEAARSFLDVADHLRVDVETLGDGDDLVGILGTDIDLQTVTAVEDLVHLAPVGTALLGDDAEEGRDGEHVVLDDAAVVAHKMQHLCLGAARAMYHAVDAGAQLVEQHLDDGGVGAGGREDKAADRELRCRVCSGRYKRGLRGRRGRRSRGTSRRGTC